MFLENEFVFSYASIPFLGYHILVYTEPVIKDPFLRSLIHYLSSGHPPDVHWFAKHNGHAQVSNHLSNVIFTR